MHPLFRLEMLDVDGSFATFFPILLEVSYASLVYRNVRRGNTITVSESDPRLSSIVIVLWEQSPLLVRQLSGAAVRPERQISPLNAQIKNKSHQISPAKAT